MSVQRAFTQKLSKQGASDVRKNVVSNHLAPKSDNSSINSSSVSLSDNVEALDFEVFLTQNLSTIYRDPLFYLFDFPPNDVALKTIPRKIKTIEHSIPKENLKELPLHVQECIQYFTRDWKAVEFSQRHYSSSYCIKEKNERIAASPNNYEHEYEIDKDFVSFDDAFVPSTDKSESCTPISRQSIGSLSSVSSCTDTLTPRGSWSSFDLRKSVNDPLIPNLLDNSSYEQVDQENQRRRQEFRKASLFTLYPETDPEDLIEKRALSEIPFEHIGHRILVKCMQLKLELEIEPIFASMAIYDAKEKKKMSENFYFDMNSDEIKKMLSSHIPYSDISTQSRTAIFEITYPSNDLFLVIRLEKVLQGDIKDSVEPYLKEDKEKYKDKTKSNAATFCERLGKYRMPFAWTGIYLPKIFNGENLEKDEKDSLSVGTTSSSNSLDRKISNNFDQLKRKTSDIGTLTRIGSLERKMSENRRSWSPDDFAHSIETFKPTSITVSSFFKQESEKMKEEDLYKFLSELKRPGTSNKKYKCIPGLVTLEISPCPEKTRYTLTSELAKIDPFPDEKIRPVKEVLEFPIAPIYNPYYIYRNLLFVSLKELNFSSRGGSARNIAIKIQLMAGENQNAALPAIFGKSSCPEFTTETYSAVNYHNKCPVFYDEIKILLPPNLNQNHHILFSLYHVSCQKKTQEINNIIETPIGYTWIPLLVDGRLKIGEYALPVMVETPPENYSFISPNVQLPGTKWLDNHRPVFFVNVEAVTSVHTLDEYLDRFLIISEFLVTKKIPPRIGENNIEKETKKCLLEIERSDRELLVKNLPIIMDKLIQLLVTDFKIGNQTLSLAPTVFEVMCSVSANLSILCDDLIVDQHGRQSLLSTYVQYQCKIPHPISERKKLTSSRSHAEDLINSRKEIPVKKELGKSLNFSDLKNEASISHINQDDKIRLLHEEIILNWTVANEKCIGLAMSNSWFLFELIIKSMIEHLEISQLLNSPRKNRFSSQLTDDLITLINLIANSVAAYHISDIKLAQSLNASLAFFIFDLLSIMDRGLVFNLLKSYFKAIIAKTSSANDLTQYKIDFLRIVCSHEHFIALNLPFATKYTTISAPCSPTPSFLSCMSANNQNANFNLGIFENPLFVELNTSFRQQHFLIGLVLSELAASLETQNPNMHGKAIGCIRNLIASHDLDQRYSDAGAKARIASLYIPFLSIVMDTIPQFHDFISESRDRLLNIGLLEDYQGPHLTEITASTISPEVAYAISGSQNYSYISEPVKNHSILSSENTRHLLISFLWVIKNLDKTMLYRWILGLRPHKVHQILQILNVCIPCFEYKGQKLLPIVKRKAQSFRKTPDMKEKLEEYIRGTGSARSDLINRRKDKNSTEKFRWRKDQMPYRTNQFFESYVKSDQDIEIGFFIDGSLSTEITLIVLDALEIIIQVSSNSELHNSLLGTVLKVLLHSLSRNQSTLALQNLFSSQRSLIFKYHNLLFDEETDICADLCLLLLKHCGSKLPSIRSQAAASLYFLMRQNFEIGNNFSRVKMQITMSLSSLVGTNSVFSEQSLRRALKTILVYAESDVELEETSFPEQVQDLLFNLHMILSDTVKMKEYQEDPEMLLDLMHRIAKGYQNSPDLRLTWLENMAKKHKERANHTEAAMCYVNSAALVAEYLSMLEFKTYFPIGAVTFQKITPNALMESAVSDDVLNPGEDGICLGNHFTENGLKALLEEAANSFQIAGMYEAMNEVYKILIPISEANRDFTKLAKIHGKLQEAFNRISQLQGKRVFGTYFRVAFYGAKFGDLDQQEFIYKEPTLTKLSEIFSRLQNFYADRFGPDTVQIIKDSNMVDVNSLNAEKAYIQITYVEPYFETWELRHRETYFERNFNIKRFMFATPFTKSGKAHGELHEQCKRKTILTTANHFPYVKTRIQVIARQQIILEPIAVAIEDIQKKILELASATNQEPSDPKILQMVLQGCIGTTVNQGPMEMASVFLSNLSDGISIPTKHQNKLRLCFKEFSKRCSDALKKNKNLITSDQKDYQKELERNYCVFVERLTPLITLSPSQIIGAVNSQNTFKRSPLHWQ